MDVEDALLPLERVVSKPESRVEEYLRVVDGSVDLDGRFNLEPDGGKTTLVCGVLEVPLESANSLTLAVLGAENSFFVLTRKSPWWFDPSVNPSDDRPSAFFASRRPDGAIVVLIPLAICGTMTLFETKGVDKEDVKLMLKVSDIGAPGQTDLSSRVLVFVSRGISVQESCFRAVKASERVIKKLVPNSEVAQTVPDEAAPNDDWLEHLGWCTWNAFYQDVDAKGILDCVSHLVDNLNVSIDWMILDDGYEQLVDARLAGFPADEEKFPGGLKALTSSLRALGIRKIGIWHTMNGYWDGLDPATLGARYPSLRLFDETWIPTSREDIFAFLRDLHSYLSAQGIDFYKVDNQGSMELVPMPLWEIYQEALAAVTKDTDVIYCMIMSPMVFAKSLSNRTAGQQARNRRVLRNSDDYFPDELASHGTHLYSNILNNLYTANLSLDLLDPTAGTVTDWDMLQTHKQRAGFHAAARALHNGPVYLADQAEMTDVSVARALAVGEHKEEEWKGSKVLRPKLPACVVGEDVFRDPRHEGGPLLKIGNSDSFDVVLQNGTETIAANFTVGLFNCRAPDGERVTGSASLDEAESSLGWRIPGFTRDSGAHVAFFYSTHFPRIVGPDLPVPVSLNPGDFELVSFAPRFGMVRGKAEVIVSCVGYYEKYHGAAAVTKVVLNGDRCEFWLRHRAVVAFVAIGSDDDLRRLQVRVEDAEVEATKLDTPEASGYFMLRVDARRGGKESLEPCVIHLSIGEY